MTLTALLWDVDGTLAETERDGHRLAFNDAFESLGLAWRWDETTYGQLLEVTGGRERLLHDMQARADAPRTLAEREALARELHRRKNDRYAARVAHGAIALRPGVAALIDEAAARGMKQGIATTTSAANVDALLTSAFGPRWATRFAACICGEDVAAKKPHPEVYLLALAALGVRAEHALAIEDSPAGVAAACTAGVPVIVTRSAYFPSQCMPGALAVGPGLHARAGWRPEPAPLDDRPIDCDVLSRWHAFVFDAG